MSTGILAESVRCVPTATNRCGPPDAWQLCPPGVHLARLTAMVQAMSPLTPAWLGDAREKARAHSMAITDALDDVRVAGSAAQSWVEVRDEQAIVYVAEPGCLHLLTGQKDPYPLVPSQDASVAQDFKCKYRTIPITLESWYVVKVNVSWLDSDRGHSVRRRKWTFHIGDYDPISFETPGASGKSADDPTDFARYLSGLVAHARGNASQAKPTV